MRIWFRLHGFEFCSWTIVWENLSEAFKALGHEIEIVDNPKDPEDLIELWWGDPQFWSWSKLPVKSRIGMALSEAHSILTPGRPNALRNLSVCETIICPSQFATTAFIEYPLDMPIKVAHFGINPDEFQYIERDWNGKLGFFHGGVTQFRKGSWQVPEAFVKAFDKKDSVYLTIASPKASPMYTQLKQEYGDHPNIEFIHDIEDSSNKYYKDHHIYVSPHLSEGFGLCPLEAMATGMCGLVARCSAPREYMSTKYGYWIEMSEDYAPVDKCLPDTHGFWRVPDVDSLAERMRYCYENRDEIRRKGIVASNEIRQNLTWERTAKGIIKIIEEVV